MERRDFLARIGTGAALTLAVSCLGSCAASTTPSGPVDFSIDLAKSENAALLVKGNYLLTNSCVVAYGIDGVYYAATVICSHEGERQITFNASSNEYYCTAHGARYSRTGAGLNANGSRGLTIYTTELSGSILRVHS